MALIDSLKWVLSADGSQFRREIDRSDRQLKKSAKNMSSQFSGVARKLSSLKGVLVGVAGAAGLGAMARDFLNNADAASKLGRALGEPTERVSTFAFAMERSGSSINDVERLSSSLARRLTQLRDPTSKAAKAAEDLGISIFDAEGNVRSIFDILTETADRVGGMENAFDAAEQGTQIFGRSFTNMLPFLEQGGQAIRDLEQRARDLGAEIDSNTGRAAEDFNDAMLDLRTGARGATQTFLQELLPSMIVISEALANANTEAGDATGAFGKMANFAVKAAAVTGNAISQIANAFGRSVGAGIAIMEQLIRGNFTAATNIARELSEDLKASYASIYQFTVDVANAEDTLAKRRERQRQERQALRDELKGIGSPLISHSGEKETAKRQASEAEQRIQQEKEAIALLSRRIELKRELTGVEQLQLEIDTGRLAITNGATEAELLELAARRDSLKEAVAAQDEANRYLDELSRRGEQVFMATRTEAELLNLEMANLNELFKRGAIDLETYRRAEADLKEEFSEMADLGQVAAEQLERSFEQFLFDPFSSGVEGMVRDFASAMNRIIAEQLAAEAATATTNFIAGLFSAGAGGGGGGGGGAGAGMGALMSGLAYATAADGGLMQTFSDGGPVRGPGTSRSDSIPAKLSNGEFVQPANSTSHYGADFMEALRRRALPRDSARRLLENTGSLRPRIAPASGLADGGMVNPAAGGGGQSMRFVLVDDRANIGDYLTTPEGEKAMLMTVKRNAGKFKQLLG